MILTLLKRSSECATLTVRPYDKSRQAVRRESENLKDTVKRAIWKAVSDAGRDDAIHPIVFRGTGLEYRVHSEVVACRVDGLALVQFLDDIGWTSAQALICHDNQGPVCGLEHQPHIQLDARVGANRLPVVARDNLPGDSVTCKRSPLNHANSTDALGV